MHVTCSNCGARYIVDPLAIGPTGRTVQCARCNHRWFERAGPAAASVLRERFEQPEPEPPDAAERSQDLAQDQAQPQPAYRSGLPAIARPPARRPRWPYWIAAAVLVAAALGAVLVFRGDTGAKSPMPWRATGLSLDAASPEPIATADATRAGAPGAGMPSAGMTRAARVDIVPAIE